jgi:predicted deacetylase
MPAPGVRDVYRRFAVVVHDVAPAFLPQLARIAEALAPRIGRQLAGAVVPCWHGRPIEGPGGGFGRFVTGAFGEVLQHGYTHRQDRPGVLSLFTGRSDELVGLPREEVRRRLGLGRELLRRALGVAPAGFVPPAWQVGRATAEELGGCGFRYLATFGAIRAASGPTIPLATWSWDWGVLGPLGRVGQRFGDVSWRLRPATLPCVVVHPADVDRGYLPRVLEVVDRLLGRGRTPGLLSEFLP